MAAFDERFRSMRSILLALLLALCVLPAIAAEPMDAPKEMVVLTVGGAIEHTNRGPLDPLRDSLLAYQGVSFTHTFAFDRSMLLALKQGRVKVQPPELQQPATFTGPLLKEVLAAVGAAHAKVTFMAIDGYEGWLSPEDIDASDWILALSADGVPLGLGQQGPLWLLNRRAEGEKPSATQEAHWVWALYYIKVRE